MIYFIIYVNKIICVHNSKVKFTVDQGPSTNFKVLLYVLECTGFIFKFSKENLGQTKKPSIKQINSATLYLKKK